MFVDVTADWCLTCKVNERLVLDRAPVRARSDKPGVVAMRADWTRPNPAIERYLPASAVWAFRSMRLRPGGAGGPPLPELLTSGAVT